MLPSGETAHQRRDRAILELLYSSGLRRKEVLGLVRSDIDRERRVILVRLGKGKKDRMIPIGDRAVAWIRKYISEVRPIFVTPPDEGMLFLTTQGDAFSRQGLSRIVRTYVEDANINKTGSCHLFRHTMATLMLENGADTRYIQEILGHADLSSTQIYTKVSIQKLKEIHRATHPAKSKRDEKGRQTDAV